MSEFLLFIHSWLRWAILLLGLYVIISSFRGWKGNHPFSARNNKLSVIFTGFFHLQVLIGIIIYFFTSKIMEAVFMDFGAAMREGALRFWAVEHILTMVIAAAVIQIGRSKIKKGESDLKKHKTAFIYFLIGLILVILRIPWNEADRFIRGM
ncbi:MAG: hypothetical protein OEX02_01505 [Cyclobacteriaceae bacterium]|nr:hypothetical protein [Cyclobacteriaceae bacterium]